MKFFIVLLFTFTSFFAQSQKLVKAELWTPATYQVLPGAFNIPMGSFCEECRWSYKNGVQLDKIKTKMGVHLVFSGMPDSSFFLTSKYKNISLIKKDDPKKIQHPTFIMQELVDEFSPAQAFTEYKYMTSNFKATNYIVFLHPQETYDLVFVFKDAEVGDTLKIDNFIEVIIK